MQLTFQTRLRDEALYPLLDAIAALYQRLQRRLFVDLFVRRRPVVECKRESIARHGLSARQFKAMAYEYCQRAEKRHQPEEILCPRPGTPHPP